MTYNLVTVNIDLQGSPADAVLPEGNYVFTPSGSEWPGTGTEPIVPRPQQGVLVSAAGSVQIVASDNFPSGVLTWDIRITAAGLPTVNFQGAAINYASGATQSVWDILGANGWVPPPAP